MCSAVYKWVGMPNAVSGIFYQPLLPPGSGSLYIF